MQNLKSDPIKCPHCPVTYPFRVDSAAEFTDAAGRWIVSISICPSCENAKVQMACISSGFGHQSKHYIRDVYPFPPDRPLPEEVPHEFVGEFREAVAVLPVSPKASAAMSRRCLQRVIREHFKIEKVNLKQEIEALQKAQKLPTHVNELLDVARNYGNFAAHATPNPNTGEIVEVEEGEADWLLEILEAVFQSAFVYPERTRKKLEALNAKLKSSGKPELK